ncbi:group I truncated hemoglobin [Oleiagrimonas soli]|uniref:Globin n=1 Tax=Oleiagrimonas soli TaxID=1543381 RepID=A0A099CUV6_9GAMM|nr:group 1 truncated hemoglobin [Oleiagrimonas soli]KGI77534.1 globin [Oleiagrimonas soli]MBB6182995.1 hemoglobin [Oleiagrimonas soli]
MKNAFVYAGLLASALFLGASAHAQQASGSMQAMQDSSNAKAMAASAPRDPALKPYFADFGGKAGLKALMEDFMANLMADPRTQPFFAHVDRTRIKHELVDQFCVILDGPCTYTGASMAQAHRGLGIKRADFNALVEDLQKAMNKHNIPFRAQNKLLAKLAPMHRDIVTKQ